MTFWTLRNKTTGLYYFPPSIGFRPPMYLPLPRDFYYSLEDAQIAWSIAKEDSNNLEIVEFELKEVVK